MFPDQSFQSSIIVGGILSAKIFPVWISSALLFWSFICATFIPIIIVMYFKNKKLKFRYSKLKKIKDIRS